MRIDRETFCSILNSIIQTINRQRKCSEALSEFCDTHVIFNLSDTLVRDVVALLQSLVNDTTDMLNWWIWEDVDKVITLLPNTVMNPADTVRKIDVSTAEKLYDYFDKYGE